MNLNRPDALTQTDRASLADRITALTNKESRQNEVEQRRSPLLEAIYHKGRASDVMIAITIGNGGLHDGYTYKCVIDGTDIALSITLDDSFTESLKLKVHAIAQALFADLGIERVSIGSQDEALRVNYFYCWQADGWVVEMLEKV